MAYTVNVIVGNRELGRYPVADGQELILGRDSGNDIVVPDRSVSRKHCKVRVVRGGVEFTDLKSANGLFSGGRLHERIVVREGEEISLGMAKVFVARRPSHTGMIPIAGIEETIHNASDGLDDLDADFESSVSSGIVDPLGLLDDSSSAEHSSISSMSDRPEYAALEKERLAILIETGKSLGQSGNLDELLSRIMDHLFEIIPVRRAVIALGNPEQGYEPRIARPAAEGQDLSAVASSGIINEVASARRGRIVEDAAANPMLNDNRSIVISNIRAAVCVPIVVNDNCVGAIYADYPGRARLYREPDLDFLTAFASIAGVSLENARVMSVLREREKLQKDIEIAEEVQKAFLPDAALAVEGLELDWTYWPSKQVGGDFCDIIDLGDGRVAAVLGDVSGKSIPAALYMARTLSFLRATVKAGGANPAEVLERTTSLLGEAGDRALFATTVVMYIDPKRGVIEWSSAGHNPVLLLHPESGERKQFNATGVPLGILEDSRYDAQEDLVQGGSILTLYTDGLVEARNTAGEEFGLDRVNAIVSEYSARPVMDITGAMLKALKDHTVDSPYLRDDVAILNIRIQ